MSDLKHNAPFGSPSEVISAFCHFSGARNEDLAGPSQTWRITRLRHELMYLLRQMTILSLTEIGRYLGGRDMATVHAGIANVADRIAIEPDYRTHVREMIDLIVRWGHGPAQQNGRIPVKVALSILQSPDLSDAEARQAALEVLSRQSATAQEVANG